MKVNLRINVGIDESLVEQFFYDYGSCESEDATFDEWLENINEMDLEERLNLLQYYTHHKNDQEYKITYLPSGREIYVKFPTRKKAISFAKYRSDEDTCYSIKEN